jgi:hypothetical protein
MKFIETFCPLAQAQKRNSIVDPNSHVIWIQPGRIAIFAERATEVTGLFESDSVRIELYGHEPIMIHAITVTEQIGQLLLEAICAVQVAASPQCHLERVQRGLIGRVQLVGLTKMVDCGLSFALMQILRAEPILGNRITRVHGDGTFVCGERAGIVQ